MTLYYVTLFLEGFHFYSKKVVVVVVEDQGGILP